MKVSADSVSNNKIVTTSIPPGLFHCEYKGIAGATIYLCCADILRYCKQVKLYGEGYVDTQTYYNNQTARRFLTAPKNPLYILDIPGKELIKVLERQVYGEAG